MCGLSPLAGSSRSGTKRPGRASRRLSSGANRSDRWLRAERARRTRASTTTKSAPPLNGWLPPVPRRRTDDSAPVPGRPPSRASARIPEWPPSHSPLGPPVQTVLLLSPNLGLGPPFVPVSLPGSVRIRLLVWAIRGIHVVTAVLTAKENGNERNTYGKERNGTGSVRP
jgi:hypothetical protein